LSINTAYDQTGLERTAASPLYRKRRQLAQQADEGLLPVYRAYGLISHEQYQVLRNDIIYLFLDNIADKIELVFSPDQSRDEILLQYIFTGSGIEQVVNALSRSSQYRPEDIILNLYIEFTPSFLALDKNTRRVLLTNTELEWHRD
jgi:hypothetical protein